MILLFHRGQGPIEISRFGFGRIFKLESNFRVFFFSVNVKNKLFFSCSLVYSEDNLEFAISVVKN